MLGEYSDLEKPPQKIPRELIAYSAPASISARVMEPRTLEAAHTRRIFILSWRRSLQHERHLGSRFESLFIARKG
jgi:hypothetical protein